MKEDDKKVIDDLEGLCDQDYMRNRTEHIIQEIIDSRRINPDKMPNTVFLSVLESCGRSLFAGVNLSKNPVLLCVMIKIYASLCNEYDKTPSIEGYCYLTGLSPDNVRKWAQDTTTLTDKSPTVEDMASYDISSLNSTVNNDTVSHSKEYIYINNLISLDGGGALLTVAQGRIYQRLQYIREESIKNKFLSSGQQIGALAVVNQEFKWDADKVTREEQARALTVADLPKITNYVNTTPQLETSKEP